ncbi:hypothetical protein BDV39DRAFT_170818 [Aspergillus sergii]|uniref:Uncharacterized protein n=1 Tax=Aspergillus sergii TaxID=1034303 RepID=A0A5N6XA64_9EURO|nr:hypothetical protein BDV39DRAFT_170818 [Aspergillus sergii]
MIAYQSAVVGMWNIRPTLGFCLYTKYYAAHRAITQLIVHHQRIQTWYKVRSSVGWTEIQPEPNNFQCGQMWFRLFIKVKEPFPQKSTHSAFFYCKYRQVRKGIFETVLEKQPSVKPSVKPRVKSKVKLKLSVSLPVFDVATWAHKALSSNWRTLHFSQSELRAISDIMGACKIIVDSVKLWIINSFPD